MDQLPAHRREGTGFTSVEAQLSDTNREANKLYLEKYALGQAVAALPSTLRFVEDPLLAKTMDRIRKEVECHLVMQKLMTEPMIVNPRDTPPVTPEDVNRSIQIQIGSFAVLLQSVWQFAEGDAEIGMQAYDEAKKQAENEYPALIDFEEERMKRTLEAIRGLPDAKLKELAEPAYLEYIEMNRERLASHPLKRTSLLGLMSSGQLSDDLYALAHLYASVDQSGNRSRFLWEMALQNFDPSQEHDHTPDQIRQNLAVLDLQQRGIRGIDLLKPVVGAGHVYFSQFAEQQTKQDTPFGRGLRSHFENVREETMRASHHVEIVGKAAVLGAGRLVITPLAQLLDEQLLNAGSKYPTIQLIELGDGLTEEAVATLTESGSISQEAAPRIDIVRGDATLVLQNLTTKIDSIMENARQNGTTFPRQDVAQLITDLASPLGLSAFSPPASERRFSDGSLSFAILTVATQDFVSPIKTYIDLWARCFDLKKEDRETLDHWREKSGDVQENLTGLILADTWRSLAPGGVMLFVEPIGLDQPAKPDDADSGKKIRFYGDEGLATFVPNGLFEIVERRTWKRPINDPNLTEENGAHFIIEALTLKKIVQEPNQI